MTDANQLSEFESGLNLLYVILNSYEGERVYDKSFGMNWRDVVFENMTEDYLTQVETDVMNQIQAKCETYCPGWKAASIQSSYVSFENELDVGMVFLVE